MPTLARSLFISSLIFAMSLPALAAPDDLKTLDPKTVQEMKEHLKSGQTHYSLGEFAEAASEFREAYRIHPEPAILFNIAQTMRQMNDYRHAYFYYSQYLSQRPDASNRADVEQFMSAMKNKMDEEAQLKAAQASGPTLPPPAEKAAAARVAKPDAAAPAGGEKVAAAAPVAKIVETSPASSAAVPPAAVVATPAPEQSAKSDTFWTGPHIGGVAAGGGAVALGALALISHAGAVSSANTLNQEYQSGTLTTQDANLKSDVDSKGKLATIGTAGAAVLLVAGAVLVFAF